MQFLKKFIQKGFQVELEDPYRYPQYEGFKMANTLSGDFGLN